MTASVRKQLIAQRADRCVHFTGIQNKTCEAGVEYESVRVEHEPIAYRDERGTEYRATVSRPCHAKHNHCGAVCEKRRAPTQEELEAGADKTLAGFERQSVARRAIVAETKGKRGVAGKMACPNKCGGELHYSVAGNNGHIWGRCTTAGCCAWME